MRFSNFVKECREKEVFKMLSIYIVTSWVLIQVLAVVQEPLGLPGKSVSVLLILLLIGFPLYILYIWKIRLAPLELEKELIGKKGKRKRSKFEKTYFSALTIITMASGLAATVVFKNNFKSEEVKLSELAYNANPNKVAVLDFHNNTGDEKLDVVGSMAADWILHGITENRIAQVVTTDVIDNYAQMLQKAQGSADEIDVIKDVIQPGKAIRGSYYLSDGKLIMQASVMTGDLEETLISLTAVECDQDSPLDCVEKAKQGILGYLATEDLDMDSLEEIPPTFKAYQYLLEAKSKYGGDQMVYRNLLIRSIDEDPDYFEPKVLLVANYYNTGEFQKADSLNKLISNTTGISVRQQNLLNAYDALIEGDSRRVYAKMKAEHELAPWEIFTNTSVMVLSLQMVNLPQDVNTYYDQVDMSLFDLANCGECVNRVYVKALADLELGEYRRAVSLLDSVYAQVDHRLIRTTLVRALVQQNDSTSLDQFMEELKIADESAWASASYVAAWEYRLKDQEEQSNAWLQAAKNALGEDEHKRKGDFAYLLGDYGAAATHYEQTRQADPARYNIKAEYAVSLYKQGRTSEAAQLIETLEADREAYQYGAVDYEYAQYYAEIGELERAMEYLNKSIAAGNFYLANTFQNDVMLKSLAEDPGFNDILTYWH